MYDWPSDPECIFTAPLGAGDDELGWITFIEPGSGRRASLPVSSGPSRAHPVVRNVWHVEVHRDTLVTTPSIHVPGEYHSPGSVTWRVVENLSDE